MELNKTQSWFYILIALSVGFVLTLGSWWLYLFFKLANKLQGYDLSAVDGNLISMLQWEGLTFFVILTGLGVALFYVFFQDHRKTKTLQAFFASMTHELKTPLASIRLQSQVLNDVLESTHLEDQTRKQLQKYTTRLQEDTVRLENELDKHLQLSRLEKNAPLNTVSVPLINFIKNEFKKYPELKLNIETSHDEINVQADEFALSMILRNMIENTIRHTESESVDIKLSNNVDDIELEYNDYGKKFGGNLADLGKLFYKYNSPKGSGIGLYIIKKLTAKMKGRFIIHSHDNLHFHLFLKKDAHEY